MQINENVRENNSILGINKFSEKEMVDFANILSKGGIPLLAGAAAGVGAYYSELAVETWLIAPKWPIPVMCGISAAALTFILLNGGLPSL